jgi:hypothetical protein
VRTVATTTRHFAVILVIMHRLADRFIHLGAALVVSLSASLAQAGGASVSLGNNGQDTARLICNGSVVLEGVYYLNLTLSDGVLLISWRESLQPTAPLRVLILTKFYQCQAQETAFPGSNNY